jgi:hypothetical protein
LVLQSCTDSLQVLPGSSTGTFRTPSDGTYGVGNINGEEDVDVGEESFIAIKKEEVIGIKHEEIPTDINFPDIKAEPDEVSYVCVCLLLDAFYIWDFCTKYKSDAKIVGQNETSRVMYRI